MERLQGSGVLWKDYNVVVYLSKVYKVVVYLRLVVRQLVTQQ